jgi:osmoprotectant transport system permease protein
MSNLISYFIANKSDIFTALCQHILLTGLAVIIGLAISLCICIYCVIKDKKMDGVINFFGFIRLIPGVALLVITMPILGVGFLPALISLCVLTIPSILICTYSGIKNISSAIIQSAVSLGMNRKEILFRIQLPITYPFILLGIRTAVVDATTIATVASLMGAGGLGRYILTGLAINNLTLTLIGGILITLLAFASEIIFGFMQKRLEYKYSGG